MICTDLNTGQQLGQVPAGRGAFPLLCQDEPGQRHAVGVDRLVGRHRCNDRERVRVSNDRRRRRRQRERGGQQKVISRRFESSKFAK